MYPPEVIDSYTRLVEEATVKIAEILEVDLDAFSDMEEGD